MSKNICNVFRKLILQHCATQQFLLSKKKLTVLLQTVLFCKTPTGHFLCMNNFHDSKLKIIDSKTVFSQVSSFSSMQLLSYILKYGTNTHLTERQISLHSLNSGRKQWSVATKTRMRYIMTKVGCQPF